MSEMWYTYWLACVEGITGDRKCELCRKNGSAEAVYYMSKTVATEKILSKYFEEYFSRPEEERTLFK